MMKNLNEINNTEDSLEHNDYDNDSVQQSLDLGLTASIKENNASDEEILLSLQMITASALFTTKNPKNPREYAKMKEIWTAPGVGKLRYTGEELRLNTDYHVWQALIELARKHQIHNNSYVLKTNLRQFLISIGKDPGGKGYDQLKEILDRLKATSLSFESVSGMNFKAFSLLQRYEIREMHSLTIAFDPEIYKFFQNEEMLVSLKAENLRNFPGLALKVYGAIRSHLNVNLTVAQYMELTGNNYKRLTQFKPKLISALKQLEAGGHISCWRIEKIKKEYVVFIDEKPQYLLNKSEEK